MVGVTPISEPIRHMTCTDGSDMAVENKDFFTARYSSYGTGRPSATFCVSQQSLWRMNSLAIGRARRPWPRWLVSLLAETKDMFTELTFEVEVPPLV